MSKKISLALLASASCLGSGIPQAAAFDAPVADPTAIYADRTRQLQQPAPAQMAYAERSNMGGGFIEFLFGDAPPQGQPYQQQPVYQQQPSYDARRPLYAPDPQQIPAQPEDTGDAAHQAFDPKYEKQLVDYHGKESAGTVIVDTPNKFLFLIQGDGKALRYGIGVGRPGFTWSGVKQISAKKECRTGRRHRKCWCGVPTCRGTWRADRKIRSARARCISDRRFIASTAPTNPGPSAPTFRQVASGCATRT